MYYRVQGERKMDTCIPDQKYISIRAFFKPISKKFKPDFETENMVSFKKVWPWNEFERFAIFSTIRLKGEVNFFIREFLKVFYFYFSSDFIVVAEHFWKGFLRSFSSECFQSLGIEPMISSYIVASRKIYFLAKYQRGG